MPVIDKQFKAEQILEDMGAKTIEVGDGFVVMTLNPNEPEEEDDEQDKDK